MQTRVGCSRRTARSRSPSERKPHAEPRIDLKALFEGRRPDAAPPTRTWWRGKRYLQNELAGIAAKQVDYLSLQSADLLEAIGDDPYADPRIAGALPLLLEALDEASRLLDLLLLCTDGDGDGGGDGAGKNKTTAEKQEEDVDGWRKDFEKEYDKDKGNKAKQKFEGDGGYGEWIKKFFITARFTRAEKTAAAFAGKKLIGWLDLIDTATKNVKPPAAQDKLKKKLLELGKKIAAEWAKSDGKIKTSDLQKWADDFEKAAAADTGDGAEIDKAVDKIGGEVDDKLK